jgi:tetratricopeptide (TPR) repeat protein
MLFGRSSSYGAKFRRKRILKNVFFGVLILGFLSLLPFFFLKIRSASRNESRELRDSFETGAFEAAYEQSNQMLKKKPLDFFLLTVHGFSAYQLAIAQTNTFDTLSFIDNCIWSLRKALLSRENDGRVFYVLGKAYYYKGAGYSDLAVSYLEKARAAMYRAADIPEYLGLAYAAMRDFRSSVEAFSLALTGDVSPSDILLLAIAKSYLALDEAEQAKAYLIRCLEITKDSKTTAAARLVLGNTLVKTGDVQGAEKEYLKVIEENDDNAEAHYQLGELYALGGDVTRARAEWRRAIRIDPAHGPARSRLN